MAEVGNLYIYLDSQLVSSESGAQWSLLYAFAKCIMPIVLQIRLQINIQITVCCFMIYGTQILCCCEYLQVFKHNTEEIMFVLK